MSGQELQKVDGMGGIEHVNTETPAASLAARQEAEVKMLSMHAVSYRRDEATAVARLDAALRRPNFADKAAYRYPRGGTTVEGPSIYLARELARVFGNIRHGVEILAVTPTEVHIRA